MKTNTLDNVPTRKLRKWLATAEQAFGRECSTARVYRAELARREALIRAAINQSRRRKGVDRD